MYGIPTTDSAPTSGLRARRQAIKQLALLVGLSLTASSLNALANSFSLPRDMRRRQQTLLDPQQLALLAEVGELIIPTTDTPGAKAAGVHHFINHQLVYCFSKSDQARHLKYLARLANIAREQLGHEFIVAPPAQQIALLNAMEKGTAPFTQEDRHFFKSLKALVIFGYYTSEIGATQELGYQPVPGGFKTIKFHQVGKIWAENN